MSICTLTKIADLTWVEFDGVLAFRLKTETALLTLLQELGLRDDQIDWHVTALSIHRSTECECDTSRISQR